MKVIKKIQSLVGPKNKGKVLIKSKFGLSTFVNCSALNACPNQIGVNTQSASGNQTTLPGGAAGSGVGINAVIGFAPDNFGAMSSGFSEIEEIYFKNNKDAKDFIVTINGVVAIGFGTANEQYETIRVSYNKLYLDLNIFIKIYSFTSGDKIIFAKNSKEKKEILNIIKSMNISSVDVIDLVYFE